MKFQWLYFNYSIPHSRNIFYTFSIGNFHFSPICSYKQIEAYSSTYKICLSILSYWLLYIGPNRSCILSMWAVWAATQLFYLYSWSRSGNIISHRRVYSFNYDNVNRHHKQLMISGTSLQEIWKFNAKKFNF